MAIGVGGGGGSGCVDVMHAVSAGMRWGGDSLEMEGGVNGIGVGGGGGSGCGDVSLGWEGTVVARGWVDEGFESL